MLRANAAIFELLLDLFPDVIQSVDRDGNIVYVNRKATELFGYSRSELLKMHITKLYAPEMLGQVKTGFDRLKREGSLSVCESAVVDKAGKRIPVEIRSFAVYDEQEQFLRTFSILRDISNVKELQDNLMHASRLAAVGELAACIVHDIANPLSVIKLYVELLQTELDGLLATDEDPESGETSLQSLGKAAGKIEKLVNHLRDLSRTTETKREVIDLRQAVKDALFMVQNKLNRHQVKVIQDLPEEECLILGHATQIEQVFMNLISNACDAVGVADEPRLTVAIQPHFRREDVKVWESTVTDNGVGIPAHHLDRVFNSFYTTKEAGKGTGLGLAIVRTIVRNHNGDIQVSSATDGGSTFKIVLPAEESPSADSDQV